MPKLSPSEFAPDLVSTMRSVLDAAVNQIDEAHRTPATKAKMAERIFRTASEGVTGVQDLITVAVKEGKRPAD